MNPINKGSTKLANILSIPEIYTLSIPLDFISKMIPESSIDENIPPCPFAANLTSFSLVNSIFPFTSSIGNSPCVKNVIFDFG